MTAASSVFPNPTLHHFACQRTRMLSRAELPKRNGGGKGREGKPHSDEATITSYIATRSLLHQLATLKLPSSMSLDPFSLSLSHHLPDLVLVVAEFLLPTTLLCLLCIDRQGGFLTATRVVLEREL